LQDLIIDSFAGGGGASLGIEMALGRSPDIAINHDAEAIAMHAANHPTTLHLSKNIWKVDPLDYVKGRKVGLAWFSPDCFPAGTMILTEAGYRRIETVKEGDYVLTHAGRYRRVYATMASRKSVRTVDIQGVPSMDVSDEHPFYARRMHNVWNNDRRCYERMLEPAQWVKCRDLKAGKADMNAAGGDRHFCATPWKFPSLPIPVVEGRGMGIDEKLMWLAGRYVGDGWSRLTATRAELVITCNNKEADDLEERLSVWPREAERAGHSELAWHRRKTDTATQFSTNHRGLVKWLRDQFGHGGAEKNFPGWALGAHIDLRRALLAGYLSADGYVHTLKIADISECNTISKALAFSIKAIVESLGYTATVFNPRPNSADIQGRAVDAKSYYRVRWRKLLQRVQTVRDGIHNWTRVQSVGASTDVEIEVFNISVEDDETYIANGIVVHNCKHFSKAKGGKPVARNIRDLAWVVVLWAQRVRPKIIMLENVEEFRTWGPLDEDGMPCKVRSGATFKRWVNELRKLGYKVEHRELRACDYGAPTIRKRLFLIARCDGLPIVWPDPTHGAPDDPEVRAGRKAPWRTAAECIDWALPCHSIFLTREEGRAVGVNRPLAENTMARIAKGVKRYVLDAAEPFIVHVAHGDSGGRREYPMGEPLGTVTAKGNAHGLVVPIVTRGQHGGGNRSGDGPLHTVTASDGDTNQLLAAHLEAYYGEGNGGTNRSAALTDPVKTVVTENRHALVTAFLAQHNSGMVGHDTRKPVSTILQRGTQQAVVTAHCINLKGSDRRASAADTPAPSVTAGGTHIGEVRAFLIKYYGADQDPRLEEPLHTVTTKHRFGLVYVHGEPYQIVDIGMRMLAPRELFRAQGFPDSYEIEVEFEGKMLSKAAQIRMCGNSVSPVMARALVAANYPVAAKAVA
jgi:site-specific DNA-cytosine methylase/intein/homing endonuclease